MRRLEHREIRSFCPRRGSPAGSEAATDVGHRQTTAWGAALALGLALASAGAAPAHQDDGHQHPDGHPQAGARGGPIRITHDDLHRHGGVPPGWIFRFPDGDPAAGRAVFVKLRCYECHEIRGERFPPRPPGSAPGGPELTGMGGHHLAEYLAESILDPNAVIVAEPGYTDAQGFSIMPDYREVLTVGELIDLVAYVKSLTEDHDHAPPAKQQDPVAPAKHDHSRAQQHGGPALQR